MIAHEIKLQAVVDDPFVGFAEVCKIERKFIMENDYKGIQVEFVAGKWLIFARFEAEGFWYDII